jgi:hypothetical protein
MADCFGQTVNRKRQAAGQWQVAVYVGFLQLGRVQAVGLAKIQLLA